MKAMDNKKQEITNKPFNMSNISKASKKSLKDVKDVEDVVIKFMVHKDIAKMFFELKFDWAKSNQEFGLSNRQIMTLMVMFVMDELKNDGIFNFAPEDFKSAVCRIGKRKATNRTVKPSESQTIMIYLSPELADNYLDIMYSYILNDENDSVFNDYHSRTYFFYDFIEFINNKKKKFLNYNIY